MSPQVVDDVRDLIAFEPGALSPLDLGLVRQRRVRDRDAQLAQVPDIDSRLMSSFHST
jgi:hypothetical protein